MVWKTLLLTLLTTQTYAITFYLLEGKERCFHDEYPTNTIIIGSHQLIDKLPKSAENTGVILKVLDPDNNVILNKNTNNEEGKFTFTTKKCKRIKLIKYDKRGDIKFVQKQVAISGSVKKKSLNISQEQSKVMISRWRVQQKKVKQRVIVFIKSVKISSLQQRIQKLQSAEKDFIKLQEMNRQNEDQLSQENFKINDRVLKATIFQTIIILLAGVFQIYSLRKFFQKKLYY